MKKSVLVLIIALFATSIQVSAQYTGTGNGTVVKEQPKYDASLKFMEMMNLIRNYYTDTVNEEKLIDDAIAKVLEDLDPHSSYVKAKDVKRSEEPLVGNFEGIGITFQILRDTIMVLEVIPSGPSEKVGLMAGDKIVKVNDTIIAGIKIDNDGVIKRLRGPKGTKVKVSMARNGSDKLIDFVITRDKIPIYSVEASYMATPTTGYIKVVRFSATTVEEFSKSLRVLREKGMKDLILDLQGNVGGYLYTAVDMCNQFLGDKELIVYTQGLHSNYQPYVSNNNGQVKEGKLIVLTDEGSASASEILAGCVQDNDRGLLVGRRTFGKGLVQKPFGLTDGSQIKLTTAHYYTPSGRNIQKPYGEDNKDYREDYTRRLESGELFGKDTFHFDDSLKYTTLKAKRTVYGGGGVMPDFFVPIDTSANSEFSTQLVRKGIENSFCLEYVDKNRAALMAKYPTGDDYFNNFTVTEEILKEYFAKAAVDSVIPKPEELAKSGNVIKIRLKAIIGRNLFDTQMLHRVINTLNNTYIKALEIMANDANFAVLKPAAPAEKGDKKAGNKDKHALKIKAPREPKK
jgi:carboxyl-terminal processing protease